MKNIKKLKFGCMLSYTQTSYHSKTPKVMKKMHVVLCIVFSKFWKV